MARRKNIEAEAEIIENVSLEEALAEEGKTVEDIKPAEPVEEEKKVKKADMARKIFDEEWVKTEGKPVRKVVIKRFIDEAGLTEKGSSTYFFNIKKKHK